MPDDNMECIPGDNNAEFLGGDEDLGQDENVSVISEDDDRFSPVSETPLRTHVVSNFLDAPGIMEDGTPASPPSYDTLLTPSGIDASKALPSYDDIQLSHSDVPTYDEINKLMGDNGPHNE
eukprot:gene3221-13900_t